MSSPSDTIQDILMRSSLKSETYSAILFLVYTFLTPASSCVWVCFCCCFAVFTLHFYFVTVKSKMTLFCLDEEKEERIKPRFHILSLFFLLLQSRYSEDNSSSSFTVLLCPVLSIPVFLTCSFTLHTWTLFLAFCLLLLFSKVLSSLCSPLSCCTIYHSLPPFHLSLSLLPSLCLSLLSFSSGSPLIKPLCLLPPCPVSTHTSHTSLSHFFVSYHRPSFSFHISP